MRKITNVAGKLGGAIIATSRHNQSHGLIIQLIVKYTSGMARDVELGFIDNYGGFVAREEALVVAREAGQLKEGISANNEALSSDMLVHDYHKVEGWGRELVPSDISDDEMTTAVSDMMHDPKIGKYGMWSIVRPGDSRNWMELHYTKQDAEVYGRDVLGFDSKPIAIALTYPLEGVAEDYLRNTNKYDFDAFRRRAIEFARKMLLLKKAQPTGPTILELWSDMHDVANHCEGRAAERHKNTADNRRCFSYLTEVHDVACWDKPEKLSYANLGNDAHCTAIRDFLSAHNYVQIRHLDGAPYLLKSSRRS